MRKVTLGVANSLDNFIARKDHAVDWLSWTDEVNDIMTEFWKTIDTVVMGRKTYEVAVENGMTAYPGVANYVFSRTMKKSPDKRVKIIAEDAVEFIWRPKGQEGKGICLMGGGELARPLFEANLIDEISLNIQPLLLGSGIPLFHAMVRQIDLEPLVCKVLRSSSIYVTYRVKRAQH